MPVITEHYDQLKIDRLKHYLETQANKGQAVPFEIFVDNLRVVPRTEDPKEFDSYDIYMNEDTEKLRILIYGYRQSPRNDQYCYMVQNNKLKNGLNGLGEVENIVQERLDARDREHEMNRLREELQATKEELEGAEEHAEQLEKQIEFLKANKFKAGSLDLADLASQVLEGIARRNARLIGKILPGGNALAGFIEQDTKELEARQQAGLQAAPEPNVSFQKDTTPELSEEDKRDLAYFKGLKQKLTPEQADGCNVVLHAMVHEPALIPLILDIITVKNKP